MKRIGRSGNAQQQFLIVIVVVFIASLIASKLGVDAKAIGSGDIITGLFALMRGAEQATTLVSPEPMAAPPAELAADVESQPDPGPIPGGAAVANNGGTPAQRQAAAGGLGNV